MLTEAMHNYDARSIELEREIYCLQLCTHKLGQHCSKDSPNTMFIEVSLIKQIGSYYIIKGYKRWKGTSREEKTDGDRRVIGKGERR